MRTFKHWTRQYVVARLRVIAHEALHPDLPWLTRDFCAFLGHWIKSSDVGLEFGSGRSTLWFARRIRRIVSVEHNRIWHARVSAMVEEAGVRDKVDYRLCEDGNLESKESAYVRITEEFDAESFDFVLIDGASREFCAMAAVRLLKPSGLLILDNANRYLPHEAAEAPGSRKPGEGCASEYWEAFASTVAAWRCIWTTDGVSATAAWFKPVDR